MPRVQSIADLLNDPHVQSREDFVTIQDATIGDVTVPNVFPRLSASPGTIRRNAPRIGAHTTEFLAGEIGIEAGELEDLRQAGAIQ